jgi:Porin subfamily
VKVCNLYGAGFYYMPGTDMCLKVGGYVRFETTYPANGNISTGNFNANANNRFSSDVDYRERAFITTDAREMTAYGVARAYFAAGTIFDTTVGGADLSAHFTRAFIQWAGFTVGRSVSAYDDIAHATYNYSTAYIPQDDTGDAGHMVFDYTGQLGGGVSWTFGAEARRDSQILDANSAGLATNAYGGWKVPDFVGNIRVQQGWGFAQIEGAAHQDNASYYTNANTQVGLLSGHPGDVWGYAVGGGIQINTPMIAPGDHIGFNTTYTVGAYNYANNSPIGNFSNTQGGTMGFGIVTDCVYGGSVALGTATSCHQTSAWESFVGYEHYWTPQWHQSFYGAYMSVRYDGTANTLLCGLEGSAVAGCNNNWAVWGVGSRLQWDITKSFFIGVDALYTDLKTATLAGNLSTPVVGALSGGGCAGAVACNLKDENNWSVHLRIQKDFLP